MANSVNPDQTAPLGAVCSGSTLFACILKFDSNVWQLFAADDFSRRHFQMHFSGAFRVKLYGSGIRISYAFRVKLYGSGIRISYG